MSFLSRLTESIPSGERLYSLLAIIVIIAAVIGAVFLTSSSILPEWQARNDLAFQLTTAEQQLLDAKKAQERDPDELRAQLEVAQTELDEAANVFLSEAQAAKVLNNLYDYANESGVEIIELQHQPVPEEEKKEVYDVRTFQLQAAGSVFDLIGFVSLIKRATLPVFVISNVNIVEGEEAGNLTMSVTLYTSPYSSGLVEQAKPDIIPTVAPTDLIQLDQALATAWAIKDWDQAIFIIKQIIVVDPDYDDMTERLYIAHVSYGAQLLAEGRGSEAVAQFNLALVVKPGGEEALAGLQQASATPTPTLTVEEQLEQDLDDAWEAADWEEAISLIEQLLEINPDDAEMTEKLYAAYVNYGYQLAAEGRLEEAKGAFSYALDIKPDGEEAMAGLQQLAGGTLPPTLPPESQYTIHVVQPGENLYRISLRYGTTVEAIMVANGLPNSTIHVGQRLRIPVR